MSQLIWTQTKPSQPGWYWWRCGSKPIVVCVYETNRGLMVDDRDIELELVANVFGEWAGPLEEPKEAIS